MRGRVRPVRKGTRVAVNGAKARYVMPRAVKVCACQVVKPNEGVGAGQESKGKAAS